MNMHFFDFSARKVFVVGIVLGAMTAFVGAFIFADAAWDTVALMQSYLKRAWYELSYQILYKPRGTTVYASSDGRAAHSIPVLLYHGESGGPSMPLSVFVDQMQALRERGWRTVTLEQFRAFMKGEAALPDRSFLLTFDDGRTDTYYPADPVMADMGLYAVMFVITGFSLPEDPSQRYHFYLNRAELSRMLRSGRWSIQSHGKEDHAFYAVETSVDPAQEASTTVGHFLSNIFWNIDTNRFETDAEYEARITRDLVSARRALEETFGLPIIAYAYPFNDYGQDTVNFPGSRGIIARVVPALYAFAFYQTTPGIDSFNHPDPSRFMIKRIEPKNEWSGEYLAQLLEGGRPKDLPYASDTFGLEWWGRWGDTRVFPHAISIAAFPDTSGSSVFLNGTGLWKDYRFTAHARWEYPTTVSLLARYREDTYVSCSFGSRSIMVERHEGEKVTMIAQKKRPSESFATEGELAIEVRGARITCYEGGAPAVSGISTEPPQGGVGISVWSSRPGAASTTIVSISAAP